LDYRQIFKNNSSIELHSGNIVNECGVDAIVNPANEDLKNGGGVAGAISQAAGTLFDNACEDWISKNGTLKTGTANHVNPGNLDFKYIINTVGPRKSDPNCDTLLKESVKSTLREADNLGITSIAIPVISSGIFGFDIQEASNILIKEIVSYLENEANTLQKVRIVNNNPQEVEKILSELKKNLGESDSDLEIITTIKKKEIIPRYLWEWKEDGGIWKQYDNLHISIEKTYENKEASYDSIIDNWKYNTGQNYLIYFDFENGNHFQINKKTNFKREVRRIENPNFKEIIEEKGEEIKGKDVSYIMIAGFINQISECEKYLQNIKEHSEEIDCNGLSIETLSSICSQFNVECTAHPKKENLYIITGSDKQIMKATHSILKKKIESKAEIKFPVFWTIVEEDIILIEEERNSLGWNLVEKRMKESPNFNFTIQKIERIQNKFLWKKYARNKQEITERNGVCETLNLFHGTRGTHPKEIYGNVDVGFDMRFSDSGMWGRGTYFAKNASYSNDYCFITPNNQKQMFLAEVLVGKYLTCPSDRKIRRPPLMPNSIYQYNSVSGNTNGSDVWIVYENNLAYPQFLITYI